MNPTMQKTIDLQYENTGGVGIYSLAGELTMQQGDDLKLILMRALYNTERAVINLKNVSMIDNSCLKLLNNAYCTSIRLKSSVIVTGIPRQYADGILSCNEKGERDIQFAKDRSPYAAEEELNRYGCV